MYTAMFMLVRDVRAAPGQISRHREPAVANDAITEGSLTADPRGLLTVTPAGERQFKAQSETPEA